MNARFAGVCRGSVQLAIFYIVGVLIGFALLVAAFRIGLLAGIGILFYRGLVVIACAGVATFVIMRLLALRLRSPVPGPPSLGPRDAFAAAILSLSLNLSFLVVVPVTVDRSISIFLLGEMAAHPDTTFTPDVASAMFKTLYVDDHRQIDRRLGEQAVSGNVEKVGDGYRISRRGLLVVEMAKITAALFDSRAGLVTPSDVDARKLSSILAPSAKSPGQVD